MTLIRWNPWNELFSLHAQMDRLFDDSLGMTTDRDGALEYSSLPIDIRATDGAFVVVASVPGFAADDVEVTFDSGMLSIRGRHRTDTEGDEGRWVRRERRVSSVFRQVALPAEVRSDEITASFENGVLTITVPRDQKPQPKRIQVNGGQGTAQGAVIDVHADHESHS